MPNDSSKPIPPYVTWGVFKSTMDTLAETAVPSGPLDRRVLHWLSGADHGALMSALRFLSLTDSENRAANRFCDLIEDLKSPSGADKFREKLSELLDEKYRAILNRVDLERGTISELEKAFREEMSVSAGQMMTKTVRFFVKAYTDGAGFGNLSSYITKPKPKTARASTPKNGAKKTRTGGAKDAQTSSQAPKSQEVPSGFHRTAIPGVPEGFIQYPAELSVADCDMFDAVMTMLRAYATARAGKKEKKP
jgi:hypothetical protein